MAAPFKMEAAAKEGTMRHTDTSARLAIEVARILGRARPEGSGLSWGLPALDERVTCTWDDRWAEVSLSARGVTVRSLARLSLPEHVPQAVDAIHDHIQGTNHR